MDRRKTKWMKEIVANIGRKAKYLSPDVTVDHSQFEEQLNGCVIDHKLKKDLCIKMTKANIKQDPNHETDVTKFYSEFNKKINKLPTKREKAAASRLSKLSNAS